MLSRTVILVVIFWCIRYGLVKALAGMASSSRSASRGASRSASCTRMSFVYGHLASRGDRSRGSVRFVLLVKFLGAFSLVAGNQLFVRDLADDFLIWSSKQEIR